MFYAHRYIDAVQDIENMDTVYLIYCYFVPLYHLPSLLHFSSLVRPLLICI